MRRIFLVEESLLGTVAPVGVEVGTLVTQHETTYP